MVCTNALEDLTGGGVIVDVGGQVAVLQQLEPAGLVCNQPIRVSLPHDGFGAVDLRVALVQQIFPGGLPGKLCGELKTLDHTVPDHGGGGISVCTQSLLQAGQGHVQLVAFFQGPIHQSDPLLFNIF